MKNVRVDLIKRAEIRYQGVVSPRFLIVTMGSALIAALLLLVAVRGIQYHYRKKQIEAAQQVWLTIGPRYQALKKAREKLAHQNEILIALEERRQKALCWGDFLLMFQKSAPENIQLNQFQIFQRRERDGSAQSIFSVKGWSQGKDAEASVISWRKRLLLDPECGHYFDSLELVYLRLAGGGNESEALRRNFEFEGTRQADRPVDSEGGAQ